MLLPFCGPLRPAEADFLGGGDFLGVGVFLGDLLRASSFFSSGASGVAAGVAAGAGASSLVGGAERSIDEPIGAFPSAAAVAGGGAMGSESGVGIGGGGGGGMSPSATLACAADASAACRRMLTDRERSYGMGRCHDDVGVCTRAPVYAPAFVYVFACMGACIRTGARGS